MNTPRRLLGLLVVLLGLTAALLTWASAGSATRCSGWYGYTPLSSAPLTVGCSNGR